MKNMTASDKHISQAIGRLTSLAQGRALTEAERKRLSRLWIEANSRWMF